MNRSKLRYIFISLLILSSSQAHAAQNYFEGKIISIEKDGTAWIDIDPAFHKQFILFSEHMFTDNLYRPYDVFRFHFHGTEIGLDDVDRTDPHAKIFIRAITDMKSRLTDKKVKILCVDLNAKKSMASCISEVDGEDVSIQNLKKGYGQTHITSSTPYSYADQLKKAEDSSKELNTGIWSSAMGLFNKSL